MVDEEACEEEAEDEDSGAEEVAPLPTPTIENEGEADWPVGNCDGAVAAFFLLEEADAGNGEREGTAAGLSRPPPPIADMPILDMRDDEDRDDVEAEPFMPELELELESAAAAAAPRWAASANVAGRYGNEASR